MFRSGLIRYLIVLALLLLSAVGWLLALDSLLLALEHTYTRLPANVHCYRKHSSYAVCCSGRYYQEEVSGG